MKAIAVDIETTGLNWKKDKILYIGAYPDLSTFDSKKVNLIWHNGAFDLKFLKEAQFLDYRADHDTYLLASLLPHESRSLLALAKHYQLVSGESLQFLEKMKANRANLSSISQDDLKSYCLLDCEITLKLYHKLIEKLNDSYELRFYNTYLLPAYRTMIDVEMAGVHINMSALNKLNIDTQTRLVDVLNQMRESVKDLVELEEKLWLSDSLKELKEPKKKDGKAYVNYQNRLIKRELSPKKFNWQSSQQILWLLRDALGIECKNYEGKDSIAESVLKRIKDRHPVIKHILEYKKLTKLKTAFLDRWKQDAIDGKLYTTYDITGTRTGRLSSSNPNLQQVPKNAEIRKLFSAPPGYSFIVNDYSQIEPRVAAHYSDEDILKWVFNEDMDLYKQISLDIFGTYDDSMRKLAKTVTLAMFYGAGARKLQWIIRTQLDEDKDYGECKEIVERFNQSYPKIRKFKERLMEVLNERQGKLYNLYGRPLFIDKIQERSAFNALIQSTASDICLFNNTRAVQVLNDDPKIDANLILLIHDESVWQVKDENVAYVANYLKFALTTGIKKEFMIPLKVNQTIGKTWAG